MEIKEGKKQMHSDLISRNDELFNGEDEIMLKEERKVLLIIDEPEVCQELQKTIKNNFGYETEISKEGEKALEIIKDSPWQYDVAVIYDDLKKKSWCIKLLEEIKRIYAEIEVIFICNYEKKGDDDNLWFKGTFNCFFRPINYKSIAYGIKYARQQALFRRERKMLDKLQELSVAITSATELQDIQNLACQAAVDILNVDHSGLVEFGKDLSKGIVIAEYPGEMGFKEIEIQVKGIPVEQKLVRDKAIINISDITDRREDLGEVYSVLMKLKIRSILFVPVILDGKVIASFSLDMIRKNRVFYSDEIEICKKLANQVAAAMGKTRYLKELHLLNKIALDSRAIAPVDPDITDAQIKEKIINMLESVRIHAGTLLDVKNFYIALYDEEKDEYDFLYHEDEKDDVTKIPQKERREGLTAYLVRKTKEAIRVSAEEIKELERKGEIKLVGALPEIWLGALLIAREKILGVIAVQNYENKNAYDNHDLTILQTIASQTAIAIDNARLFRDAQRRIRDLEIDERIIQTISTKLNTKDLFKTMVTQITEKLKCSHCTIFLPEKRNGELKLIPQETYGLDSERIKTRAFKIGEGLAGWVFRDGISVVTPDAGEDPRYIPARKRKNLPHSMLVVPVKVGSRTIGVISAEQDKENWFSETDRRLLETIAAHAGIAIERGLGLNLLLEIGKYLISSENESKILQRVITGAIELTNTTTGILYLLSEDSKSIDKQFSYPPDYDHPKPRMGDEDGYGFTREIIERGKMVVVPDVNKESRINRKLLKNDLGAMIGVPLKIEEKVIGVLYLNAKESRSFSETECSLLEILANRAAIGIYNSRLYQESQKRLSVIDTLYEASQEIATETMNVKFIFDKISEKAFQLSNADSAQILFPFHEDDKDLIKIVSSHGLDALKGITFKKGEGLTSKVFEKGESIYTGDYHNHPDRAKIFDKPEYKSLYNSLAIVPLKWKGKVVGAIAWTSIKKNNFKPDDIHLLERFSGAAAIAIATSREFSFRQTLLNNNPDAIVAINKKGIIKEFNRATEQMLGYTHEEILNQSVEKLWGSREEARRIKCQMLQGEDGTVKDLKASVVHKDGEKIPVLFAGSLLYSEGYGDEKEEIGSIGHLEDLREIRRLEKSYQALYEVGKVAVEVPASDMRKICQEFMDVLTKRVFHFKASYICLMNEENELELMAIGGTAEKYSILRRVQRIFSKPGGTKELYIKNVNKDKRFKHLQWAKSNNIYPSLVSRLYVKGNLIGEITVFKGENSDFSEKEKEFLERFAGLAALVIDNARDVQRSMKIAKTLQEFTYDIVELSGEDIYGDIWEKITDIIARWVPNSNIALYQCDPGSDQSAARIDTTAQDFESRLKSTLQLGEKPFKSESDIKSEYIVFPARSHNGRPGRLEGFLVVEKTLKEDGTARQFGYVERLLLPMLASAVGSALFQLKRKNLLQKYPSSMSETNDISKADER